MRVPISWLKDYIDIDIPLEELTRKLTMAGIEVSSIETIGESWSSIFISEVIDLAPHPNADRLKLATVSFGKEPVSVVCGAPNISRGQRVAFAMTGANLIDPDTRKPTQLKPARIRGVLSEGMICSELELGIGENHLGIMILPEDAPIGTQLSDYLGDKVLDLEITSNRPDCLSVLGIAHEIAALTGGSVKESVIEYPELGEAIDGQIQVDVKNSDLCPRYMASLIRNVTIKPSPMWLQSRLRNVGLRPINNVVDITNYVMIEHGQPLHAFDFDCIDGGKIIVKQAKTNESFPALNGETLKLLSSTLTISDNKRALGVAGVIGGAQSEIKESTRNIVLEAASFSPQSIRRTAQALKIRTDACLRFEKGLRPNLPPLGLKRATELILELSGGEAAKGIIDVHPKNTSVANKQKPINLAEDQVEKVLGVHFSLDQIHQVLTGLGFSCKVSKENSLSVTAPYWRSDISEDIDLIEEVARITGYDSIPTTMLSTPIPNQHPQPLRELREKLKDLLVSGGMQEVITYSLVSLDDLEKVKVLKDGPEPLRIANPLHEDQERLRTSLRASLLKTLASNQNVTNGPIKIFEASRTYIPKTNDLPEEREMIAGILCGPLLKPSWANSTDKLDFFDGKGLLSTLLSQLGLDVSFIPSPNTNSFLISGKSVELKFKDQALGILGEIDPQVLSDFQVDTQEVVFFELDLSTLLSTLPLLEHRLSSVPKFPGAIRDISIVADDSVPASNIQDIIESDSLIKKVTLFDVYRDTKLSENKRSLAYQLLFQVDSRTLKAKEVDIALKNILKSLKEKVGANLRE